MLLTASHIDGLTESQAREIIAQVIVAIRDGWMDAADGARLSAADRTLLWSHQFLNPGALYDY